MTTSNEPFEPTATISKSEIRLLREFLDVSARTPVSGAAAAEMLLTSLALALSATRLKT